MKRTTITALIIAIAVTLCIPAQAVNEALTLTVAGNGFTDQAIVYFDDSATTEFDPSYDAFKLFGTDLNIYTQTSDSELVVINAYPPLNDDVVIPGGFYSPFSTTFTITPTGIGSFHPSSTIYLEDLKIDSLHDLRSGPYSYTATPNDSLDRFLLRFTPPLLVSQVNGGCSGSSQIFLNQRGSLKWDYTVTDTGANVVASDTSFNGLDTISGLAGGTYYIDFTNDAGYTFTDTVMLTTGGSPVSAGFTANDTVFIAGQDTAEFTNTSTGGTTYHWDFGDGDTSTLENPTHLYNTLGTFTVTLVVDNGICSDTSTMTVYINKLPCSGGFTMSDTVLTTDDTLVLTNQSFGASTYHWDFGDGDTSNALNPTHSYDTAGSYVITLTIMDGQCSDIVRDTVTVLMGVGIEELEAGVKLYSYGNSIFIQLDGAITAAEADLNIYDMMGRVVSQQTLVNTGNIAKLELNNVSTGYYVVQLKLDDNLVNTKLFIKTD